MNKLIDTVTFCKRIGKLTLGFDLVKSAMMTGEAVLILLAGDLSPKSEKEIRYLAGQYEITVVKIELTMDEFWYLVGKRCGIIAVTDPVFADKILAITTDSIRPESAGNKEDNT